MPDDQQTAPSFVHYPQGIPIATPQMAKPLHKMINQMFKRMKMPKRMKSIQRNLRHKKRRQV